MKEITNMEMSYFAGIFDGDGSFSLCKKIENINYSPLYYPLIQLSTTNFCLIDMLLDTFGGNVTPRKAYIDKNNISHKKSIKWKLEKRNKCFPFLEKIVPFLIIKQERASFLIDFINYFPFKRGSKKIDENILNKKEKSYIKMHSFNHSIKKPLFKFPKKRIQSEDDIFWNYFAGLMDTDGSFSLKREVNKRYAPIISISMVDSVALFKIVQNCKYGRMYIIKAKTSRNGHSYRYMIGSLQESILFLEKIIPYLRLKKKQASILLEYCLDKKQKSKLDIKICEQYYKSMIEANNGVYKPSLIDLEAVPDNADGDRAEDASRGERLSEKARKGCDSLNS